MKKKIKVTDYEKRYDNGCLKEQGTLIDDKREGKCTHWLQSYEQIRTLIIPKDGFPIERLSSMTMKPLLDRVQFYKNGKGFGQHKLNIASISPASLYPQVLPKANYNEQIKHGKVSSRQTENNKYTTTDYALFHYYMQECKHEPLFEKNGTTTKREAIKLQGKKYNVGVEAFANCYYKIITKGNRICKSNIPHIKKAIELLSDYPSGIKTAQEELNKAEVLG